MITLKKFKITLKSGHHTVWEAENEEEIWEKIRTGHYGILPIRGNQRIIISVENLDKIEDIIDSGTEN